MTGRGRQCPRLSSESPTRYQNPANALSAAPRTSALWQAALLLLLAACGACTDEWHGWDDVPTAQLAPRAPADHADEWAAFVTSQAAAWAAALAPYGCPPPFEVGDRGHVVALVEREAWPYGDGTTGMTLTAIEVRETKDGGVRRNATLLHELGHAIGLDHADPRRGPSVMTSTAGPALEPRDAAAAACRIGCGPCDPAADPYSIPP